MPALRVLPSPEERLRSLAQGADHAEAWAKRFQERTSPYIQLVYSLRRRIATGAVLILAIWLCLHVTFGANGTVVYRTKRAEYKELQNDIRTLQQENQAYTEEVNQLKTDPKRIEKEAREQFHYARPGEVIYVSPEAPARQQPVTHSASK